MVTRVSFPQVAGEWVRAEKFDLAIKQRDELRDALDDLINRPFKPGTRPGEAQRDKARAALKETADER